MAAFRPIGLAVIALVVILLLALFSFGEPGVTTLRLWPSGRSLAVATDLLFPAGVALGVVATRLLVAIERADAPAAFPIYAVAFLVGLLLVAAAFFHELALSRIAVLIVLGPAALLAATRTIELLGRGDAVELQSRWGGLGGGLGGWRLSPAASLLLLTLFLAGAAVAVVGARDTAGEAKTSAADMKLQAPAEAKGGPAATGKVER
jgi:hypothetical protein